jgi:hypothetical protein
MSFDLTAIERAHRQLEADTKRAIDDALRRGETAAKQHVRDNAGFTHRSGATLNATRGRLYRSRRGGRLVVLNSDRKALWLEHGTRAHVIRARRGTHLRFFWRRYDRIFYFRKVNHPGTRAYRFLFRAAHHAGDRIRLGIQRGMQRAARRF